MHQADVRISVPSTTRTRDDTEEVPAPASGGVTDTVVVAHAGMLSAANLNALEDAGFSFIVGSRLTKAPYDLAEHFERTARELLHRRADPRITPRDGHWAGEHLAAYVGA